MHGPLPDESTEEVVDFAELSSTDGTAGTTFTRHGLGVFFASETRGRYWDRYLTMLFHVVTAFGSPNFTREDIGYIGKPVEQPWKELETQ